MPQQSLNAALIVEGGALRGVFSTGVLDGFLAAQFNPFAFYLGVSSGASNLASYLATMPGRNYRIYTDYSLRPEFINIGRFLRLGHLMDLDWLWNITIREMRLDLSAIYSPQKPFIVVLTNAETGEAVYKETDAGDLEHVLKASSALPLFYRDFPVVDNQPMTDGGLADALPVREAIKRGASRIMVIRSRKINYRKKVGLADYLLLLYLRRYPLLRQAISARVADYNEEVLLIRQPPAGISIVEVCPPDNFQVSRFTKNRDILQEGYEQGQAQAASAIARWNEIK